MDNDDTLLNVGKNLKRTKFRWGRKVIESSFRNTSRNYGQRESMRGKLNRRIRQSLHSIMGSLVGESLWSQGTTGVTDSSEEKRTQWHHLRIVGRKPKTERGQSKKSRAGDLTKTFIFLIEKCERTQTGKVSPRTYRVLRESHGGCGRGWSRTERVDERHQVGVDRSDDKKPVRFVQEWTPVTWTEKVDYTYGKGSFLVQTLCRIIQVF